MKRIAGIIINCPNQNNLEAMTGHRSIHTVPFGGKYRLIDFPLSNFVNSGIRKIGVIGSYKYRSLADHLGSGEDWNLSSKSNDLSILHGGKNKKIGEITRISIQDLIDNKAFFRKIADTTDHILLSNCNSLSNIDVEEIFDFYKEKEADVVMVYKPNYTSDDLYKGVAVEVKRNGEIIKILNNSDECMDHFNLYAGMMFIKLDILENIIEDAEESGELDLMDVVQSNLDRLKVYGFEMNGYLKIVNSLKSYFDASMYLLDPEIQRELFYSKRKIYTKTKDNHPTKYNDKSKIRNSIIASGAHINGTVENSIIFREATIAEGAVIRNSVIMQNCVIEKNTEIINGILDKYVRLTEGKVLKGTEEKPILIKKDSVI
jgi:glucose-1-phosphate adenylyltransferase